MTAAVRAHAAQFRLVADSERGQRIQERLDKLRISDRQFQERSGIDRKTLRRAVAGGEHVRESTYRAIESWLDRLERIAAGFDGLKDEPEPEPQGQGIVKYRLKGDFGVDLLVEGPVDNLAALEASVVRMMREMRAATSADPDEPQD
jgi:hypothetical protein